MDNNGNKNHVLVQRPTTYNKQNPTSPFDRDEQILHDESGIVSYPPIIGMKAFCRYIFLEELRGSTNSLSFRNPPTQPYLVGHFHRNNIGKLSSPVPTTRGRGLKVEERGGRGGRTHSRCNLAAFWILQLQFAPVVLESCTTLMTAAVAAEFFPQ